MIIVNILLFFIIFSFTNVLFSLSLGFFLLRFNTQIKSSEILIHSLGVGPALTTLILYYSFLAMPNYPNGYYVSVVCFFYGVLAFLGRKTLPFKSYELVKNLRELVSIDALRSKLIKKNGLLVIFLSLLLSFFIFYFLSVLVQPLRGHDMLIYGTAGNMLSHAKSLAAIWVNDYSQSGFLYRIKAAPSFPLILTWERLVNSLFRADGDLYFKSIGMYYGLLITVVQYLWLSSKSRWIALLSTLSLVSGLGFYITFFLPHIDTYRIYFIILSYFYLGRALKDRDNLSVFLFGMFLGLSAYTHRIGLAIAIINYFVFIVMVSGTLKIRLIYSLLVLTLFLAMGGSHYILDLILGQGLWMHKG